MNTQLITSKTDAVDLLKESLSFIPELKEKAVESQKFMEWRRNAEVSISRIFGDETRHLKEFQKISYRPSMVILDGKQSETYRRSFLWGIAKAEATLNSMISEIEKFWANDEQNHQHLNAQPRNDFPQTRPNSVFDESKFVLHKHQVFVLSPFGEPFDTIYSNHIKPTVVKIGKLYCQRADDIYDNQPVINDIWRLTNEARIVIADLTNKNPNVFYETGLAHAIGKEVILITQSMNDVPFDLKHRRCIVYGYTPPGIDKLQHELTSTITNILNRTDQSASSP